MRGGRKQTFLKKKIRTHVSHKVVGKGASTGHVLLFIGFVMYEWIFVVILQEPIHMCLFLRRIE